MTTVAVLFVLVLRQKNVSMKTETGILPQCYYKQQPWKCHTCVHCIELSRLGDYCISLNRCCPGIVAVASMSPSNKCDLENSVPLSLLVS